MRTYDEGEGESRSHGTDEVEFDDVDGTDPDGRDPDGSEPGGRSLARRILTKPRPDDLAPPTAPEARAAYERLGGAERARVRRIAVEGGTAPDPTEAAAVVGLVDDLECSASRDLPLRAGVALVVVAGLVALGYGVTGTTSPLLIAVALLAVPFAEFHDRGQRRRTRAANKEAAAEL